VVSLGKRIEKLLWSIALPGFGQLLNGKYIKGVLLISLEFLVNVKSNFNEVIISSFRWDISKFTVAGSCSLFV